MQEMIDVTAPASVEVRIKVDSRVVWVNVNGQALFRACQIGRLEVVDDRIEKESLDRQLQSLVDTQNDLDMRTGQLLACRERCEALESAVKSVLCHHRVVALRKLGSDTLNPRIELLEKLTEGGAL
jgi:hypothetical protein